ncbi:MAG: outer membrane lipoprotein carrier protein LolA [Deltaproteobacteria bacterium]|nr:outer membrane lipoprotein carrier protein LolA [Deltaproteobacteria bacterium]
MMNRAPNCRGRILLAVLSFFLLGAVEKSWAGREIDHILDGILERYGALPGLFLTYEREIITKSMTFLGNAARKDSAKGRIYFKPPHYLRVEQETPTRELVVSDGKTLWWYIPDKEMVYRYPARKLGEEMELLSSIFQGLKQVEERFDVSEIPKADSAFYHIRLTPRPPWPQIEYVELAIARDDYHIRMVGIFNYLGDVTRFVLGVPVSRDVFQRGFFQFDTPPGTKVIEEGDQ